jgi:alcohol dehydrogenase class IV
MTDQLALSAIRLISHNLRTAYAEADNLDARSAVMLGAMRAGMAFSNSSVALIHGMARPLGAHFHLTHGISIAALLPVVTEFSLSAAPERYAQVATEMDAPSVVEAVRDLNRDVGLPTLGALGIPADRFQSVVPKMAGDALASGSPANNPRLANAEEIAELYHRAYSEHGWARVSPGD